VNVPQVSKLREMNAKLAREAELKQQAASKAETNGNNVDGINIVADKAAAEKAAAEKFAGEKAAAEKAPSKGKGTIGLGVKPVMADGKQTGLTVTRLVSGGASERSGKILVGHSLATVDGVDVSMMAIKDLAVKALAGDAGTSVVLGLKDDGGRAYTVELMRDSA
jgi:hypothetical protein